MAVLGRSRHDLHHGLVDVLHIQHGTVTEPEPTVLATEEPETMPIRALATTATLAGPPEKLPTTVLAIWMKYSAMPVRSRKAYPNRWWLCL